MCCTIDQDIYRSGSSMIRARICSTITMYESMWQNNTIYGNDRTSSVYRDSSMNSISWVMYSIGMLLTELNYTDELNWSRYTDCDVLILDICSVMMNLISMNMDEHGWILMEAHGHRWTWMIQWHDIINIVAERSDDVMIIQLIGYDIVHLMLDCTISVVLILAICSVMMNLICRIQYNDMIGSRWYYWWIWRWRYMYIDELLNCVAHIVWWW